MLSKHCIARFALSLILLGSVAALPALAGSAVVGSVAGSMNATVGGQTLLPNTTLFSGDSLQVKDGVAVVALGSASRMVFGRDTAASFLQDPNEVTVLLTQGSVSLSHEANGMPVRMRIGDVSVVSVWGFKTLGEVAMLNGAVVVTAKEGMLRVEEGRGRVVNVGKGKTITVLPEANAPQGGGKPPAGAGRVGGGSTILEAGAVGAGAVAAILAGVAMSRSGTASSNASAAESDAAAADSTAALAASAAAAAASAAAAAASAAAGGTSAAEAAASAAAAADSTAAQAASAAAAAASAASAAASTAAAGTSAADAAASAAAAAASAAAAALSQADAAAIAAGCALNLVANQEGQASPYTPPPGVSCSNPATW
jgi:hypothetical protein